MTLRSTPDATPRGIGCACAHPSGSLPSVCPRDQVHSWGPFTQQGPDGDSGEGPPWDPISCGSQRKPWSLKAMKAGRGAQREDAKQPAVAGSWPGRGSTWVYRGKSSSRCPLKTGATYCPNDTAHYNLFPPGPHPWPPQWTGKGQVVVREWGHRVGLRGGV